MLKTFSYVVLLIAAAMTIIAMLRAADGSFDSGTLVFMAWAISPYVLLAVVSLLLQMFGPPHKLALVTAVVAVLMLAVTMFFYLFSLDGRSSTEALVFVFVPLYLIAGGLVTLGVGLGISWLVGRSRA